MPNKDEIIKRLTGNLIEVITDEEFSQRITAEEKLTHYIGFEISGYVHIGQGIVSALVIKELQALNVQCTIWLADWHTAINEKLDGRKETAARIGKGYFTEAMKGSIAAVGGNPDQVEFRLASEWYAKAPLDYWELVRAVMHHTSLARLLRSIDIMGRKEGEAVEADKLLYPAMQVADILYQNIDIAHAGIDQRKAHVVMRDVADQINPTQAKPMALHHPLLLGLEKPPTWPLPQDAPDEVFDSLKMSKSKPDSAIWVHDTPQEIERKIKKAFCPEKEIGYNPILNWAENIIFWDPNAVFLIEREEKHGGPQKFTGYEELEKEYSQGNVHPMDLKNAVAKELIELLEPVREHFEKPDVAAKKAELDKLLKKK